MEKLMNDVILVTKNKVVQKWINKSVENVAKERKSKKGLYSVEFDTVFCGMIYDEESAKFKVPSPQVRPFKLPKLLILERLQSAGKFEVAESTLKEDSFKYQCWLASQNVDPSDPDVRALLESIGADLDVILAKEQRE